jgi:signal transduction histidine kinase
MRCVLFACLLMRPCAHAAAAPQTSLRDFLATTSHDARTPLSSIQARSLTRSTRMPSDAYRLCTRALTSLLRVFCTRQVASQLLLEKELSPEAHELLNAISASARVLLSFVNNVMLTKRLDAGARPHTLLVWR